jgi:hypothetical protein
MTDRTDALTIADVSVLIVAGQQANEYASENLFEDYRRRAAANTLRRQEADLAEAGVFVSDLLSNSATWRGITINSPVSAEKQPCSFQLRKTFETLWGLFLCNCGTVVYISGKIQDSNRTQTNVI